MFAAAMPIIRMKSIHPIWMEAPQYRVSTAASVVRVIMLKQYAKLQRKIRVESEVTVSGTTQSTHQYIKPTAKPRAGST